MHDSIGAGEGPWLEFAPGERVAGFTIEGKIASGSFGIVYEATRDGKPFALKLVPMGERGDREVDALRRARLPNVVGFRGYCLWPEENPRFLVLELELVKGEPLDVWARNENPSALELVRQVVSPLARTLAAVHAEGVVHRDVKEANIVMRESDGQPVLVDFGAAAYEGAPRLTMRLPPGTREYRSPEAWQFAREWEGEWYPSGPRDDLWALGVTLYFLLTRELPFGDRNDARMMHAILHENPAVPHVLNPRVPPALGELCLRMLEKQPEARYADATALEQALEEVLARADDAWHVSLFPGGKREKRQVPRPSTAARSRSMRRPWAAGLALAALVLLHDSPEPTPREESTPSQPTSEANSCQELAPSRMTGEVVHGAELPESFTPAPVASATSREEDPVLKSKTVRSLAVSFCVTTSACVSSPQQRPPPPPEACPAGSADTLTPFGIEEGDYGPVFIESFRPPVDLYLAEGDVTAIVDRGWKGLPEGTPMYGKVLFGNGRVYGRFTRIRLPGGEIAPVCLEVTSSSGTGIAMKPERMGRKVRVINNLHVMSVRRFE
ncbi:protein kinase [Archangium violaceum]|uniref:serine/threonine protein kinase n=1 Tax=Archangium violaceum TaxID=83451 RepID=UPI0019514447|nr:serine/threonine protein kinase [Archangium violaceum]QRN92986.1 protein kinase [Archangium violaceum]